METFNLTKRILLECLNDVDNLYLQTFLYPMIY